MNTTEMRVVTLEKQVRRQRRWNIALGIVLLAGGLMAAAGRDDIPDVVRAKRFEVMHDGISVATLGHLFDGGLLQLYDDRGTIFLGAGYGDGGKDFPSCGSLFVQSPEGSTIVRVGVTPSGGCIQINENSTPIAEILSSDGSARFDLKQDHGKKGLITLGSESGRGGVLKAYDDSGELAASFPMAEKASKASP